MSTYTVQCTITEDWQVQIEANSEAEAMEKVEKMRFDAIRNSLPPTVGDNQLDDDNLEVHCALED